MNEAEKMVEALRNGPLAPTSSVIADLIEAQAADIEALRADRVGEITSLRDALSEQAAEIERLTAERDFWQQYVQVKDPA